MRIKSLHTTSAFQFFQVARYAALMIGSIFLAHSGISQQEIGVYETVLLLSGSLSFFWINGILTNFMRSYTRAVNKREILSNTVYLVVILTIILLIIITFCQIPLLDFFSLDASYFRLFVVFFLFNNIVFLTEYILLAKDKAHYLMMLGVFHLLIQSAFIAIPAVFYQNIDYVITGLLAFSTLKFVLFMLIFVETKPTFIYFDILKSELKTSAPLILSFFLGGISIYVDGIIINAYYDKSTFAVYQYGAKEFPVTLLLANALSVAMVKNISSNFEGGVSELRKKSLRLMHILFPTSIFLLAASKFLYPVVFSQQFAESYVYFNIYLLLIIPRLLFPQTIINAMGKTNIILSATSFEFILNIILSLILLKIYGPAGVAYATILAFCVERIILMRFLSATTLAIEKYVPLKPFFTYSFILLLVFIFSNFIL